MLLECTEFLALMQGVKMACTRHHSDTMLRCFSGVNLNLNLESLITIIQKERCYLIREIENDEYSAANGSVQPVVSFSIANV